MVIKLYISGISGNKEVKKKQQRVQMILDSKQISYEAIDITEPGKEKDKEFMQQNGKVRENLGKYPLPPQIFNDDDFCGDYEDFDMANEVDELEKFLHIETNSKDFESGSKVNGLQEEIISNNNLIEEKKENEEVTKSEVNGESAIVPTVIPSSENMIENIETSGNDVLPPVKEEPTAKGTTGEDDIEENVTENQEREVETETQEKEDEDENENSKNLNKDEGESPESTPLLKDEEEGKVFDDSENIEIIKSEGGEEDAYVHSESEKSQEE